MVQNELDVRLRVVKHRRRKAFIAYLAAGYPRFAEQKRIVKVLEENGVDVLELGIPFSDPIADGPTIQFASQKALENGTTLKKVFAFVDEIKRSVSLPIVFMSYLNPIWAFGVEKFAREARRVGVSGVIVPDLIPEESSDIRTALSKQGVHLIHLVAPTTTATRLKWVARQSKGFLYAVSVTGVTGARRSYSPQTKKWLNGLQRSSRVPVCVGFGISGPTQVRQLKSSVDGFIVGSALIDVIRKSAGPARLGKIKKFVRRLAKECSHGA